jgi:hypothetical protein
MLQKIEHGWKKLHNQANVELFRGTVIYDEPSNYYEA